MTDTPDEETPAAETPAKGKLAKKKKKRKATKGKASTRRAKSAAAEEASAGATTSPYPRHSVDKALRIPKAILEQHAGKPCTANEAASFVGAKRAHGPFRVELSSASKYGFLNRPESGKVQPTELAKQIIRPQKPNDEIEGYRQAILTAPIISDVYKHYRGENLPDDQFLKNTVVEKY